MSDPQAPIPPLSDDLQQLLDTFVAPPVPDILYRASTDMSLSFKAKGVLLALALSNSTDGYTVPLLASMSTDGRTAVTTALEELEQHGYLRRERARDENGTFTGHRYVLLV